MGCLSTLLWQHFTKLPPMLVELFHFVKLRKTASFVTQFFSEVKLFLCGQNLDPQKSFAELRNNFQFRSDLR